MLIKKHDGMSLVEIVVVVTVIGILASLGIPSYMNAVEKSRSAEVYPIFAQARKGIRVKTVNDEAFNIDLLNKGSASNYAWDSIDMENPNANPNGAFCYDGWSAGYNSGNRPAGCTGNVIVAAKRIDKTAYEAHCDYTKWLCINVDTGDISKSSHY